MSRTSVYIGRRKQCFSKLWCSHLNKVSREVINLIYISPEQTTWTAPLCWQVPPGQGTLGQDQSSGSSPLHLNSSAQTRPSDSLKGTCPRTDTTLPHPRSAQMTWAVGNVKFPSDTGVQSSPEWTSTRPEQGPSPSARRVNPKRNRQANPVNVLEPDLTNENSTSQAMNAFFSRSSAWRENLIVGFRIAFSWTRFWREIQKNLQGRLGWLYPNNVYSENG